MRSSFQDALPTARGGGAVLTLFNDSEFDFYSLQYTDCITEYLVKSKVARNSELKFAIGGEDFPTFLLEEDCPCYPDSFFINGKNEYDVLLFCRDEFNRLWSLGYRIDRDGLVYSDSPELLPS